MPNLLGLEQMGVEWLGSYPSNEFWLNDRTRISHGETVKGKSGRTTSSVVDDSDVNEIFGHIHRIEQATRTAHFRSGPEPLVAFSPGCLCHIDGRVPAAKGKVNWQQGFGIIDYHEDGRCQPNAIQIHNGRAFAMENEFVGQDYTEQLRRDTIWNF